MGIYIEGTDTILETYCAYRVKEITSSADNSSNERDGIPRDCESESVDNSLVNTVSEDSGWIIQNGRTLKRGI